MAWRGSRARGVFRALACIVFSSERPCLRSPVAAVRQGLVGMLTWPILSAGKSKRPTFMAKAIANYGRDCALPGSLEPSPGAPGDGRERLARAPSRRAQPREDARRNHRHRQGQWNVGNGHEPDRHPRGRAGLCFRRRRTRELRNRRHSRRAFSQSLLEPVRQGVHRCFGAIAPGVAHGLKLRHDHGSNYMSGDFQDEIKCLGIEASPSFVREPEGNGVAERFIRTLKENLLWVRTFDTIEELRAALLEFARHYNETWLVARHGYRTPAQVRADQCRLDHNAIADLKLAA